MNCCCLLRCLLFAAVSCSGCCCCSHLLLFRSQFEIAQALQESEELRSKGNPNAAARIANSFYVRHKAILSLDAQRNFVLGSSLVGVAFIVAIAPFASFPDHCDGSNTVSVLLNFLHFPLVLLSVSHQCFILP